MLQLITILNRCHTELFSNDSVRGTAAGSRESYPKIDESLVETRDALAHGRISALPTADNMRLIKFEDATLR